MLARTLPALCKGSNIIFTSSLAAHASVGASLASASAAARPHAPRGAGDKGGFS